MKPDFSQYGFHYPDNLIQAFIGGSQLHRAKVDGTDDTDWYGVFIEPPQKMIGLDRDEFFVFTTGGKAGGNGPRDVDVCLYSLRKWTGMAAKGNPSALHFVFAKEEFSTPLWDRVVRRRDIFASKRHEYDTKYAMHVIRLYLEAKEYMEAGRISLPNPKVGLLIDIRQGKYKLSEVESMGRQLQAEAMAAHDASPLPESVDLDAVTHLITEVYLEFWTVRAKA